MARPDARRERSAAASSPSAVLWLATFTQRAWANVVDVVVTVAPLVALAVVELRSASSGPGSAGAPEGWLVGGVAWLVVFSFLNRGVAQGRTGRSLGKALLGLRLLDVETERPPGVSAALAREVHQRANGLVSGYLRVDHHPLAQTYADTLAGTVVVSERRRGSGS